jgi:hypothetical protein
MSSGGGKTAILNLEKITREFLTKRRGDAKDSALFVNGVFLSCFFFDF